MTSAAIQPQSNKKKAIKETLLTPRFYTTDFEAIASMDISSQEKELRAMLTEMKNDYNRNHFIRDEDFEKTWDHVDGETRAAFIEFLERSCTSEFSGFILFKEISRRIKEKNPLLSEVFSLMARDEARHAGFLNKAMGDFNISLDLGYLTKHRVYTFFKPEWIIYAVYLSEKNWLLALYLNVSSPRKKIPTTNFIPSSKNLNIGVKTKAVMETSLTPSFALKNLCGKDGKPNYGQNFSFFQFSLPIPSPSTKGKTFINP